MNSELIMLSSIERLIANSNKNGYRIYESHKDYDLNIHVVRSSNQVAGSFDDIQVVFWKYNGIWKTEYYGCTCDPSDLSLLNFKNRLGSAIVMPGQLAQTHQLGFHKGRADHPALVQVKPITVIRDYNRDTTLDWYSRLPLADLNKHIEHTTTGYSTIYKTEGNQVVFITDTGLFGINNHRASAWQLLEKVGLYSEGCIVQNNPQRYNGSFIPLLKEAANTWGDIFSITVHTEAELRNL